LVTQFLTLVAYLRHGSPLLTQIAAQFGQNQIGDTMTLKLLILVWVIGTIAISSHIPRAAAGTAAENK
jgi:hypothetical protein